MDTNPLISVIIPCYNAEKSIESTLNSVLEQSYANYEIVCIDNNSTDRTIEVIQKIQKENPGKIVLTNEKKQNASAARMKGLSIAKGSVIQFLDADDLLGEGKFKTQIQKMVEVNADVVVSDMVQKDYGNAAITMQETFPEIEKNPLTVALEKFITSGNPLYKTAVVNQIGYDAKLPSSQDFDFHLRMALANIKFVYTPGIFFIRRFVQGSLSSNSVKTAFTTARVLIKLRPELEKRKDEIKKAGAKRVCQILYDCAVRTENNEDRKSYIEELRFWSDNKIDYLNNPMKTLIAKAIGVPGIIALDTWRIK